MEPLRRQVPLIARTTAALALALLAGCVTPGSNLFSWSKKPAVVPITSMAAMWQTQAPYGVDPTQGGAEVPAIVGRDYLFGPDRGFPQLADGAIVAELHLVFPNVPPGQTAPLETWRFDKDTLNHTCLRRDFLGQGYTLCLRWSTYRPEFAQVFIKVRYEPAQGNPIYGESSLLTLNTAAEACQVARQRQEGLTPAANATAVNATPAARPTGLFQPVSASQIAGPVPERPVFPAPNLVPGSPAGVAAPAPRTGAFNLNLGRP
jgi:hypothetical protein